MKHRIFLSGLASVLAFALTLSLMPAAPRASALTNPCALDPKNLIVNGSMAPGHATPYGIVAAGWEPFVLSPSAPAFEHVTNEQIDANGSQYFWADGQVFDAGIYQTVTRLTPGMSYRFWLGYALAAHDPGTGQNVRTDLIGRQVGIDLSGGTDPRSPRVIWGPAYYDGFAALNIPELSITFAAPMERATIFLRGVNTDPTGRNKIWFDSVCMEALAAPPASPTPTSTPTPTAMACVPIDIATIPVGSHPKAIATDPATHRLFVALFDTSSVAVIDTLTMQRIAVWAIQEGGNANGLAYANGRVYVSLRNSAKVAVLDASNGNSIGSLNVGRLPYGIGATESRVWVANFQDNSVSVIDGVSSRLMGTHGVGVYPSLVAPLKDRAYVSYWGGGLAVVGADGGLRTMVALEPGTYGVAANVLTNRVFVTNRGYGTVSAIDANTNAVVQSVTESSTPFAIAVNPATNHLFTVMGDLDRVRVRDATSLAWITDLPLGVQGDDGGDGIAVTDNQVFVANNAAGTVSVLSDRCSEAATPTLPPATMVPAPTATPTTTRVSTAVPTSTPTATVAQCSPSFVKDVVVGGRAKGIAVDPANRRAYVALFDSSSVAVIDALTDQKIATWSTNSSGHANALAVADGRLFVTLRDAASLAILDAATGKFIAHRAVGALPYGIAGAPGNVWVANFGSGSVSRVDAQTTDVSRATTVGANPALVAALEDRAYVALWGGGVAVVGGNGTLSGKITDAAPRTFGVAANPITQRIYFTNRGNNNVSIIDARTNAVLRSTTEPSAPYALAVNPATNHLFVVLGNVNRVRVHDATSLAFLADLPIGLQGADGSDGIAVLGDRVYVSNNAAGTVSVLQDGCPVSPTPAPTPTATSPPPTTDGSLQVSEEPVQLSVYVSEPFLSDALDSTYNIAYKRFDVKAFRVAPPQIVQKIFKTVIVENDYLRLTFMPEVGGRLWQVLYKPTGQAIFYNNRVLKPTPWGPAQQSGWLGVGGMEWALPVDEHGYEWGVPWSYSLVRDRDRVTITLQDTPSAERVRAQVSVTLPANAAYFIVHPRVENPTRATIQLQFWVNALIALNEKNVSPQTEFVLPTTQVLVHSTGDDSIPHQYVPLADVSAPSPAMPWPLVAGRDLSRYKNWVNYLGVFAPVPASDGLAAPKLGFAGAYDHANDLGIARVFPPDRAPGVKLFAFGPAFDGRGLFADDGSDYFELWGGLPRTFFRDDNVVFAAGQAREWDEYWIPFARTGGLSAATQRAVLYLEVSGGRATIGAAASAPGTRGVLVLDREGVEMTRWIVALDPGNSFRDQVEVLTGGSFRLRLLGEDGAVIAETP